MSGELSTVLQKTEGFLSASDKILAMQGAAGTSPSQMASAGLAAGQLLIGVANILRDSVPFKTAAFSSALVDAVAAYEGLQHIAANYGSMTERQVWVQVSITLANAAGAAGSLLSALGHPVARVAGAGISLGANAAKLWIANNERSALSPSLTKALNDAVPAEVLGNIFWADVSLSGELTTTIYFAPAALGWVHLSANDYKQGVDEIVPAATGGKPPIKLETVVVTGSKPVNNPEEHDITAVIIRIVEDISSGWEGVPLGDWEFRSRQGKINMLIGDYFRHTEQKLRKGRVKTIEQSGSVDGGGWVAGSLVAVEEGSFDEEGESVGLDLGVQVNTDYLVAATYGVDTVSHALIDAMASRSGASSSLVDQWRDLTHRVHPPLAAEVLA